MPQASFSTIAQLLEVLESLRGRTLRSGTAWNPAQVLQHCAQSVDGSLRGYPKVLPGILRATVGRVVVGRMLSKGVMRHNLVGPLPGGPPLDPTVDAQHALQRLLSSVTAFEAHGGPLQPHVLFGVLEKGAYGRYHVLHMADHFRELSWD